MSYLYQRRSEKMYKKILQVLILFSIILVVVFPAFSVGAEKFNDSMLVGVWLDSFPVSANACGYFFFADHRYIYYDLRDYNIQCRYGNSMGKWKIENNKIYIYPVKDFYYEKDWVYHEGLGEYIAGDSNPLYITDSKYDEWVEICNLDTLMEEQTGDYHGRTMVVPINFKAKYIINGIVSEKTDRYFKIGEDPQRDSYVEYIMTEFPEEFNGLLEK